MPTDNRIIRRDIGRYLMTAEGRDATDFEAGEHLKVSRGLVGQVRMWLIWWDHIPEDDKHQYKVGAVVRGGYLRLPDGSACRSEKFEEEYRRLVRERAARRRGRKP